MSCLIDDVMVMWQVVSSLWSSMMLMLRVDYRCVVASSLLLSIAFAVLLFYVLSRFMDTQLLCRCSSATVLLFGDSQGPVQRAAE